MLKKIATRAICAWLLLASAPVHAQPAGGFSFSKVDLDMLDQVLIANKKFDREGLVYHDEALTAYVNQVGRAMLPSASAPERVSWDFRVLRDPMPNAFALPNGTIYVNSGLLSLLENEDQLASVLAHEITHVTDRHTYLHNRDYRKKMTIANVASFVSSFAPGGSSWGAAIQSAGALIPFIMLSSINGYSRELERIADIYAFHKLIEGGYDPREMPNTFRLLGRQGEVEVAKAFYNDHPKLEERIGYITSLVESKSPALVPAEVLAERRMRFQTLVEGVMREDVRLAILARRPRTALARATKLVDFHPNSPDNIFAKAEAFQALGPWRPRPTEQELSSSGKKEISSLERKFTREEQEGRLLAASAGQASWKENLQAAEEAYRMVLSIDPSHAATYRGLGQLFEKQQKKKEAIEAYGKYLELQSNALDQFQIRRRIESLQRSVGQE